MKTTIKTFTVASAIFASSFAMASTDEPVTIDMFLEAGSKYCEMISEDAKWIANSRIDDTPIYDVLNLIKSTDYDDERKDSFINLTKHLYSIDSGEVLMYGAGQVATDVYMECIGSVEELAEKAMKGENL